MNRNNSEFGLPSADRSERRRLMDDREPGWDCVSQMRLARSRPEVLANALLAMGITENGDEMPDQERIE